MSTGYVMVDSPNPVTPQGGYPRRGGFKPTGTCIVHTTEGAWTSGVQSLTNLVRSRADYGCYHQACDWQDIVKYYPWEWECWQDSETNPWAVGISAACRTTDWASMPADIREGYYRNMGRMAADFVNYMRATYGVTVPLKRISGAQARAGVPGFAAHGDSGVHRSDPGVNFDWDKFFNYTRQALGSAAIAPKSTTTKGLFMSLTAAQEKLILDRITKYLDAPVSAVDEKSAVATLGYKNGEKDDVYKIIRVIRAETVALKALVGQLAANAGTPVDYDRIDAIVEKNLTEGVVNVDVSFGQGPSNG